MGVQLSLDLTPAAPNPNAGLYNGDGTPKKVLWCNDTVRIAFNRGETAACPYVGARARFRPGGSCCLDLARQAEPVPDAPPKRTQMKGELPGTTWEDAFGGAA